MFLVIAFYQVPSPALDPLGSRFVCQSGSIDQSRCEGKMGMIQSMMGLMKSSVMQKLAMVGRDPLPELHQACLSFNHDRLIKALEVRNDLPPVRQPVICPKPMRYCEPIHLAPSHWPIVNTLLTNGADVNARTIVFAVTEDGTEVPKLHETVLAMNVRASNVPMVQFLLRCGADPKIQDARGHDALEACLEAVASDAAPVMTLFGPMMRQTETTPLAQRYEIARCLLKAGCASGLKNHPTALVRLHEVLSGLETGQTPTPFDYAVARKWLRSYIVSGAMPPTDMKPCWCTTFLTQVQHFTPLHWAAADGRPELCVKYLGLEGSDPYEGTPEDTYCSPLSIALRPQQHRALLQSPDPNLSVQQVMQAATGRWKPSLCHLWTPSFNKMALFLSWATPLSQDMVTKIVGFLEREDALVFVEPWPASSPPSTRRRKRSPPSTVSSESQSPSSESQSHTPPRSPVRISILPRRKRQRTAGISVADTEIADAVVADTSIVDTEIEDTVVSEGVLVK